MAKWKNPSLPSSNTVHRKSLVERIDEALQENGGEMHLHDLEKVLYPEPRSHSYSSNGGPPGCRMAVSAAIRRGGFSTRLLGGLYGNRIVKPRKPITNPDFVACDGCGFELYHGDLTDGLCGECLDGDDLNPKPEGEG